MKRKITLRYDLVAPLARFVAQNYRDFLFHLKDMQLEMFGEMKNLEMQDIENLPKLMLILLEIQIKHKLMLNFVI